MNILIFNQKGGVGKTTTALNLGVGLSRFGDFPVTLVDLDPQTHLTAALGLKAEDSFWNVTDWLANRAGTPHVIGEKLSLITGDPEPAITPNLVHFPIKHDGFFIIDAPPVWNQTVAHLMSQADWILTPLEPEFLSMQGVSRLFQTMERQKISRNRLRLLLCRFDARLVVHREVRESLTQRFNDNLLGGVIRKSVRLAEAPSYGWSIFDYAPDSSGANDYLSLTNYWLRQKHLKT
ncbi:MAG: ParA family protein [Methylococcales bacterium]|nr:ParA family protein [Methylococcales bacterium]MDD5754734.1 ParA family protein [Methylococcales bacterium]